MIYVIIYIVAAFLFSLVVARMLREAGKRYPEVENLHDYMVRRNVR